MSVIDWKVGKLLPCFFKIGINLMKHYFIVLVPPSCALKLHLMTAFITLSASVYCS